MEGRLLIIPIVLISGLQSVKLDNYFLIIYCFVIHFVVPTHNAMYQL